VQGVGARNSASRSRTGSEVSSSQAGSGGWDGASVVYTTEVAVTVRVVCGTWMSKTSTTVAQ
jgi:hypothetical protein